MTILDYNKCVDDYADALYRFILRNIKDIDTAQDIVQEAFVKMWEKYREIAADKAKSYLFTIGYHVLVDHTRYQEHFTGFDRAMEEVVGAREYFDLQELLHKAVEKLPAEQKRVLLLRDYEGYSYDEIGEITGLSASQVKVYIYRARLFLKKFIGRPEVVI